MRVNHPLKKVTAIVLAGVAVGAAAETGPRVLGADSARPVRATTHDRGNANAVPPMLRAGRPSELAEIRSAEAWKGEGFRYEPPARAGYSGAVLNVFAKRGRGGS
jgi:hypothetical protein